MFFWHAPMHISISVLTILTRYGGHERPDYRPKNGQGNCLFATQE
jgi:hypothetical protein